MSVASRLTGEDLAACSSSAINHLAQLVVQPASFDDSEEFHDQTWDKLVQWCHGAPGFTALLLSCKQDPVAEDADVAATPTHPIADLKTVIHDTMEVIWQRGILYKGCSICHGTAGNGYSFLSTYLHTQDEEYLWRTVCFAEIILDIGVTDCCATSDHPLSLFEGVSRTAQFLMDVAMVLEARQSTEGFHLHSSDLFDELAVF
eukprot:gene9660-11352_t